ncbi:MAG: carbon-nitrogen hydrolase family protein [Candidatus Thermoplasmatota archaeon]|jgi:predicted amidohydrolase|nr:carbon-nitrogen hydrolase family protein [Candidatus Thermoplasmatota archaeon]MCL5785256.1 carbon-nitrogen hydrolase family protein [Candidatus Thermoplasmatota archaeon]
MEVHAVQFQIRETDFSPEGFRRHVESFYKLAEPKDILVFPEDLGLLTAFTSLPEGEIGTVISNLYQENLENVESLSGAFKDADPRESLFVSLTDKFVCDFYSVFSEFSGSYEVYSVACNNMASFRKVEQSYIPVSSKIFNTAYVFDTNGNETFRQRKVYLTEMENSLALSSGELDRVKTFDIEGRKFGIAISLDAFMPAYVARLSGADIILQPDANPGKWASYLENGRWQPEEWMESAHYIAQRLSSVRYVVNPMMVGNLADVAFEGQSSITKKASASDTKMAYVGNIPAVGFHSVSEISGFDPAAPVPRNTTDFGSLIFDEKVLSVEI